MPAIRKPQSLKIPKNFQVLLRNISRSILQNGSGFTEGGRGWGRGKVELVMNG